MLAKHRHGALYVGMTNDLSRRVYEQHATAASAIQREKTIKHWSRNWKIHQLEKANPLWSDLYDEIVR